MYSYVLNIYWFCDQVVVVVAARMILALTILYKSAVSIPDPLRDTQQTYFQL